MGSTRNAQILSALASSQDHNEAELHNILDIVYEESSSSSSSDFSSDSNGRDPRRKDVANKFAATIEAYDEDMFKAQMKMNRSTVEYLISRFSRSFAESEEHARGRVRIDNRTTVYIYIWHMIRPVTFSEIAALFGVTQTCAWKAVRRISTWLISIGSEYIRWPKNLDASRTRRKFQMLHKMPDVIGAVGCTHIRINPPNANRNEYLDPRQHYSLVLQVVVDADKRFTDISCGEPGALEPSKVLRRSEMYRRATTRCEKWYPDNAFILGCESYFETNWLLTPFKDNGDLTDAQRCFNEMHAATYAVVGQAFRLLKTRFPRLFLFNEYDDVGAITNRIVSICILHNICMVKRDFWGPVPEDKAFDEPPAEPCKEQCYADRNATRRALLLSQLELKNIIQC